MVARPTVHRPSTTVGEIRAFFDDDHVHMALLVEDGMLIGVVERTDVLAPIDDRTLVREVARLDGRTIGRDAALADALALMRRTGRRRLAAIDEAGALAGLLCLKSSGRGFCSDRDVAGRRM